MQDYDRRPYQSPNNNFPSQCRTFVRRQPAVRTRSLSPGCWTCGKIGCHSEFHQSYLQSEQTSRQSTSNNTSGHPSTDAGGKPILGSPSGQSDPIVLQSPRVQLINTSLTTDALGLPYSGASKFIESKDDSTQTTYVRPISTTLILGNKGPRILAYI